MRKMISGTVTVLAMTALLAGSAMAAEKLVVKGTGGAAGNVFRVDNTGLTEARAAFPTTDASAVLGVYNSDILRMKVKPAGITEWQLNTGTAEAGFIKYSTPGGGVGFRLSHAGDTNPMDVAFYPNIGGQPMFLIGGSATALGIKRTGEVGVGIIPTQKFHVNGGIRVDSTGQTKPACDANARGTFWFTTGTTDTLEICATTATGLGWKAISLP